jgi:hypothetical protein
VASFCSKCGAAIAPGAQACGACGAPVVAGGAVSNPAASPAASGFASPAAGPPAVPVAIPVQAVAPQPKSGSSTLKVVLIIVAVFVGLGFLGMCAIGFIAWRAAHAIRVAANGEKLSLSTPGGTFSANGDESFSASDLGTDIYPGATAGKGSMRMTLPTGTMVSGVYVTSDSKDQVAAFYKSRFGTQNVTSFDSADGSVITYAKSQQESVVVTINSSPSEYDGKTQIHIVHTTSTKSS